MNSSFLNEIFSDEGEELVNISATLSKLISHTNTLKNDVTTIVENQLLSFEPVLKENTRLIDRGNELLKEIKLVEDEIEREIKTEIEECTVELDERSRSLKEINLFLNTLTEITEIDSQLRKAKQELAEEEYHKCAQLVKNLQENIRYKSAKFDNIEIFKVLSQEVSLTYDLLLHKISDIWSSSIKIRTEKGDNSNGNLIQIELSINIKAFSEISKILKASNHLDQHTNEKKFSQMLLNDLFNPIIIRKSEVIENVNSESAHLLVNLEDLQKEKKPNYLNVFENIKKIIKFIGTHLNVDIGSGQTFLQLLGSYIAIEFVDSLIKNYLSEFTPSNSKDLDEYKEIVTNASDFEKSLQNINFIPKDSSCLMEYAANVNALFANKFCQAYLNKARNIMKADLHNVTFSEEIISDLSILPGNFKSILKSKMNIKDEIFSFYKCQISKHAKEIIDLMNSMMSEIEKSMEPCSIKLFYAVRNMFEMYCAIVPLYHKKFLETLPHQVALFHNNCLYFAHNLIHIATEDNKKISSIRKSHFAIFLEQAVALRSLAAEKLESAVMNQRNQLIYILRDSGFAKLNENPKLDPNAEKSLRQCLRQLQILEKVWIEVLPINIYNRAIGFLIDAIIEELTTLILSVEDISSQTATDLVSSFSILTERIPKLFPEEKEIPLHVRKWQKFHEFVLVLKGSLRDIDDRWANGLGPLAVEFTPEQVKHMIRALFQNSDRRAALLSKIR